MKKVIGSIMIVVALAAAAYVITGGYLWKQSIGAKVIYGGRLSAGARVYHPNDYSGVLVNLESEGDTLYVFGYSGGTGRWFINETDAGNWHFLPLLAISESMPPPGVELDGVKTGPAPEIVVQDDFFEFTSKKAIRVRVEW